ncbi:hypothetical protein OQA88_925 [Cercophora sp. LCS_1]
MTIKAPANLPSLVKTAFHRAVSSGDVSFFPTHVALLSINSNPFQLRYSPSLASKPRGPPNSSSTDKSKPPFDPFDNPSASMLVAPVGESHILVLNKFAIVPEHFILATKAFKPQTGLLEGADLEAAYACVQAYHEHGEELFVFFNSGEHSGASQPHRHLQLLVVDRMKEGLDGRWDVLAKRLEDEETRKKLPFGACYGGITPGMTGDELAKLYEGLYQEACGMVGKEWNGEREAVISYNLAMTGHGMVVMPRVSEGAMVDGVWLGLNGTVLAGTALVKSEREWDVMRGDGKVEEVLGRIGVKL